MPIVSTFYCANLFTRYIIAMRKGFTLVELSIVLVIIGLLIGGILAAQSMISTVKVQSLVRQLSQFDAAIENFQTKYNGLPGDTAAMGCADFSGDGGHCGDGQVDIGDYSDDAVGQGLVFSGETALFWSNLSSSGVTNPNGGPYTNCISSSCSGPTPGVDVPKSAIDGLDGVIGVS